MSPEEIIQLLHLTPLTGEGGMVAETYTSEEVYGNRRCGSAIYYMLTKNSFSHLHMLSADEIWHFYYGDPVELIQIRDCDGRRSVSVLGQDIRNGERPQILVEKNSWQGARLLRKPTLSRGMLLSISRTAPGNSFCFFVLFVI